MLDLASNLEHLLTLDGVILLLTLSVLEIVLGIDNIIFISIIAGKLPKGEQKKARTIGLVLALIMRVILLFSITWLMSMTKDLFTIAGMGFSGRDLILFSGGVFLIWKTTVEIHNKIEGYDEEMMDVKATSLKSIIFQIVLIDIVFSFDSILTAVGISQNLLIMVLAVIVAMIVMIIFSEKVSNFINNHPTIKMLALAFLIMIGLVLVLESFEQHVEKAFVYVAIAFSLAVEALNMRMRKKSTTKKNFDKNDDPRDVI